MGFSTIDIQARINALYDQPHLLVDGAFGPKTQEGIRAALVKFGGSKTEDLFGKAKLHRIHWHWTAGSYDNAEADAEHYNMLFTVEGKAIKGGAEPEDQARYDWQKGVGVSHTKNANTGAIGLSVAAMGDAEGWPLDWGKYPLTWVGIDAMLKQTAEYCKKFDIPVTKWSTLSHAEVQPTLNIQQNGKWDYRILPDMTKVIDAVECGDILRKRLKEKFM